MAETAHPEAPAQAEAEGSSQAPAQDKRPVYEVGFHVLPTVGDDGVAKVVEAVRKAIAAPSNEDSAEFISEGFPQKITFTYTIERSAQGKREKYTEGYFGWIKFATEREEIPALQAALTGTRDVLRFLIIETVREDVHIEPKRAVFTSDRLEGKTLERPTAAPEKAGEISEEELDKSIEALTG